MYRRVVPGLPVMMALGNALGEAVRKQSQQTHPKPSDHDGSTDSVVGTLRPPATPPASREA